MADWRKRIFICTMLFGSLLALCPDANADGETVLYSFQARDVPVEPLLERASGALIGVARDGGSGYGTVYRLFERSGAWREKSFYQFPANNAYPSNVIEKSGALYGVTAEGGQYGAGAFFSLVNNAGTWTASALYSFTGGKDGSNPVFPPLWVKEAGAFFGTTPANVSAPPNCGSVYRVTPDGTETTLHHFRDKDDGCSPNAELHEIHTGNGLALVGTTEEGGNGNGGAGNGAVFLEQEHAGRWHESVIYHFADRGDGAFPGDIAVDGEGNIFGVTQVDGGKNGQGVVFELSRQGSKWVETTLHTFLGGGDGENPAGLCRDDVTGNLYGVTTYGGTHGRGILFQMTQANGAWTESVLHSFDVGGDGQYPASRPIYDPQANVLYGTTRNGGQFDGGVVYKASLSARLHR